jgi:addiction module HigA family antidote
MFEWPKDASGPSGVEIVAYPQLKIGGLRMARTAIHPGEHLGDELGELGISAAALARQIAVPVNRITQIINCRRAITADTALRLGHWFGTGPEIRMNLQQLYELRRATADIGAEVGRLVLPPLPSRL